MKLKLIMLARNDNRAIFHEQVGEKILTHQYRKYKDTSGLKNVFGKQFYPNTKDEVLLTSG